MHSASAVSLKVPPVQVLAVALQAPLAGVQPQTVPAALPAQEASSVQEAGGVVEVLLTTVQALFLHSRWEPALSKAPQPPGNEQL